MNRRRFIVGVTGGAIGICGTLSVASVSGMIETPSPSTDQKSTVVEDVPRSVEGSLGLAEAFRDHIRQFYPNARVFVDREDGAIAMTYETDEQRVDALKSELNRVVVEFVSVVETESHSPVTFTVANSRIRATVPRTTVRAHVDGQINQEAFLKTVSYGTSQPTGEDNA